MTEQDLALLADVQEKVVRLESEQATATGFDVELIDIRLRVLRKSSQRLALECGLVQ